MVPEEGNFPSPRELWINIIIVGIPLLLCDEQGIALLVKQLPTVEESRMHVAPRASVTTVDVTVKVCSVEGVLPAITFNVGAKAFVV